MDIKSFKKILYMAWTIDTCIPLLRDKFNKDNKSLGQSDVTALVVNDCYGGKIMCCMTSIGSYYYNLIDDKIVDLTGEQFLGEIPLYNEGRERTREFLLNDDDTRLRYIMLLKNVKSILENLLIYNSIKPEEFINDCTMRKKQIERMMRYNEYEQMG